MSNNVICFRNKNGFADSTDRIRFVGDKCEYVRKDGIVKPTNDWTLAECRRMARRGWWSEVSDTMQVTTKPLPKYPTINLNPVFMAQAGSLMGPTTFIVTYLSMKYDLPSTQTWKISVPFNRAYVIDVASGQILQAFRLSKPVPTNGVLLGYKARLIPVKVAS